MILFHLGAVAALFFFTWKGLVVAIVLTWVSGAWALESDTPAANTPRFPGFKVGGVLPDRARYLGSRGRSDRLGGNHRIHHQNTGLWAHMGRILTSKPMPNSSGEFLPFVPDLRKDKFYVWISKWHWAPLALLGVAIFAMGGCALSAVGYLFQDGGRSPRHVAREFRDSHVGIATVPYQRNIHE